MPSLKHLVIKAFDKESLLPSCACRRYIYRSKQGRNYRQSLFDHPIILCGQLQCLTQRDYMSVYPSKRFKVRDIWTRSLEREANLKRNLASG